MTDLNPRLEEIAKAAAEISTISSEEAFEAIVEGINKVPEQLQAIIDSVVAIQFDWPMPEEGWKRFVEDVAFTNVKYGLNLHVNPPDRFDSLSIVEAQEKYAASINKTRDELDDTEKMQAMVNAVLARGERSMTELLSYKMYTVEMIKLVKATLRSTTEPLVPFKIDPLEFCREAHKVKDELVSNALNLLENDIAIEQKKDDGWISVEEAMPREDALYLVYSPSANIEKPFIGKARFNPDNDLGWSFDIIKTWLASAITYWMPLPEPPTQESKE